jgi:hypothetical protein
MQTRARLGRYFGKSDPRLALAREWARAGISAGGPGRWRSGCLAGVIIGRTADGQWVVHNINDGGAVGSRPH